MIAQPPDLFGLCFPTVVCPSTIAGAASHLASDAASSVLSAIGAGLSDAATWVVNQVLVYMLSPSQPDVGSSTWIQLPLQLMEKVVFLLVLPILSAASIGPVLRQDGRRLLRVWGIGLPVALFAGFAGSQLTDLALRATDAMSAVVVGGSPGQASAPFSGSVALAGAPGAPLFVQMLIAVLTLAGALLIWLELIIRSAGVYVATFFMPLTLLAYVWPATAGIAKRGVEVLVALVLSKFVIVASLSLGYSAMLQHKVDTQLAGAAILLLAGFAPFALFRLAPVVEAAAIGHLEGMSHRAGRIPGRTVAAVAAVPEGAVVQTAMRMREAAKSGGDPASVTRSIIPDRLPEAPADYVVSGAGSRYD